MSKKINIDGTEYSLDALSDKTKNNLSAIRLCDAKILDLNREIEIIKTARIAYGASVQTELKEKPTKPASKTGTTKKKV